MNTATDTLTGQHIEAESAIKGDFEDRYLCPCCSESVFLAGGDNRIQRAHFKHRKGGHHENCENFVGGPEKLPFFERDSFARSHVIVCALDRQGHVCFGVRALLRAPAKKVSIDQGGMVSSHQILDLKPIAWITSPHPRYFITISYAQEQSSSFVALGFDSTVTYIFKFPSQIGALVPLTSTLQSGDYLILQNRCNANLPPELEAEEVILHNSDAFKGWYLSKFTIPARPGKAVIHQFFTQTGYRIVVDALTYGVIQPAPAYGLGNKAWQIEKEKDWSILVRFPTWHPQIVSMYVQRKTPRGHNTWEGVFDIKETQNYVLISGSGLIANESSIFRIAYRQSGDLKLIAELHCVSILEEPACIHLKFVFSDVNLLWSSHVLPKYLRQVREGRKTLEALQIPAGVTLQARAGGKKFSITNADSLISLCATTKSPISLFAEGYGQDFDGYGKIVIDGPVSRNALSRRALRAETPKIGNPRKAEAYRLGQISGYAVEGGNNG